MLNTITNIDRDSPARGKVKIGDELLSINGHGVEDVLDYRYWSYEPRLSLVLRSGETGREYTDDELRKLLSGHLCRCTGYENILRAVKKTMYKRLGKPMPTEPEA